MTETMTTVREYRDNRSLASVARGAAGSLAIHPNRAADVHFDAAWSNSLPANLPEGEGGSTVLDVGRGILVRATGNASPDADGVWRVTHMSIGRYESGHYSGREVTCQQRQRAEAIIGELVTAWAAEHADDLEEAERINRNNGARTLEESLRRHEEAMSILYRELEACETGEAFDCYPDLPTKR